MILGISDDSTQSHSAFATKYSLPFTLLSDKGGGTRKLYGVKKAFGVLPGRVTFVIDRDGIIRRIYSGLFESEKHVQEALARAVEVTDARGYPFRSRNASSICCFPSASTGANGRRGGPP